MQDEQGAGKKELTQSDVLKQELLKIAPDVTKADRIAFLSSHAIKKTTLSNYLNGKVSDNDTAVIIIKFMKDRIQQRFKQIA